MKPRKQIQASRNVSRRANIEKLKQGPEAWGEWCGALRARNPDWRPDLRDADLAGLELEDLDFSRAILAGADLRGASCDRSNFRSANLRGANLEGADLIDADLRRADLDDANLANVDLSYARLQAAHFFETRTEGTDFDGARIGNTYFIDVKLDTAEGLESVNHYAPSHLSLGTLTQSGGNLPKSFLRGCGVPPLFQTLFGGTEADRRLAFEQLHAKRVPRELPQRYIMHLYHGWRARDLHRYLNEKAEFSWHLMNLASESSLRDEDLHRMSKNATVLLLANSRWLKNMHRPIFKRLERARKRHGFKIILLSWWKRKMFGLVKHQWMELDELLPFIPDLDESVALMQQLGLQR